jgi:hypothetical protein
MHWGELEPFMLKQQRGTFKSEDILKPVSYLPPLLPAGRRRRAVSDNTFCKPCGVES